MNKEFAAFLHTGIDLSCCGLIVDNDFYPYFCTPKDASYIGRAGVDGIHFCFVRGFGETIFSVSPMSSFPDYVHPVARSFNDFLRLIISCGDTAAIEQAYAFDHQQFDNFLSETKVSADNNQFNSIKNLAEKLNLNPIEDPYKYIRDLQSAFDYSKIKYTEDFYDSEMNPSAPLPEWKVYYGSGFTEKSKRSRAGSEYIVNHKVSWAGASWHILSLYHTGKGIVADIFIQTDKAELCEKFNPFIISGGRRIYSNGAVSAYSRDNTYEIRAIRKHYKIADDTDDFAIMRFFFSCSIKQKALESKIIKFVFSLDPSEVYGKSFKVHEAGEKVEILNHDNAHCCTLTVIDYRKESYTEDYAKTGFFIPQNFFTLSYSLDDEKSYNEFRIRDICTGDQPLEFLPSNHQNTQPDFNSAIAVIGGADGPTVLIGSSCEINGQHIHTVCSSLYFAEPHEITWAPVFMVKQEKDLETTLSLQSLNAQSND